MAQAGQVDFRWHECLGLYMKDYRKTIRKYSDEEEGQEVTPSSTYNVSATHKVDDRNIQHYHKQH